MYERIVLYIHTGWPFLVQRFYVSGIYACFTYCLTDYPNVLELIGSGWAELGQVAPHIFVTYIRRIFYFLRVQVLVGDRLQFFVRPVRVFDVPRLPFRG